MDIRTRPAALDEPMLRVESEPEILTYLGMRRLMRARPNTEVLGLARSTIQRHARARAAWRAGSLAAMRVEHFDMITAALVNGSGAVVALPHCGPYFGASLALADRDVLLSVLAERSVYDEESADIERLGASYRGTIERPASELVQIIDVGRSTAAWETIVAVRRGRVALAYFDNNFGLDARSSARTMAVFTLCGAPVVGRLGAALLAGTAGVPLIPAMPRFGVDDDPDVVELYAPLLREDGESLDAFAFRATSSLFALLEREIERDPTAWDLWFGLIARTAPLLRVVVEREPEMNETLAMCVRLATESIEELDTPYGRMLAHLDRGTTLIRSETYDAVAEIVADGASVEKLVFDLSPVVGNDDLALETIRTLVETGFLVSV